MAAVLPHDLVVRSPSAEDAGAVAAVINACGVADGGNTDATAEEVLDDWHGTDLQSEAVIVVSPEGQVVGYADLVNRAFRVVSVYGYVHPTWRRVGIGSFLVDWGERWIAGRIDAAPAAARIVVQQYILVSAHSARALLEERGYAVVRQIYEMEIDPDQLPPPPAVPAGLTVRPFVLGRDDRACFGAVEDAFRDVWGRPPGTFAGFKALTARESFVPALWLVAWDGDEIAGAVLGKAVAGNGWVDVVAVRRPWRGRGLGLALLRLAFAAFHRLGIARIGLSVDAESATGAPRLYLRAGMRVERSYLLYRKEIRPGADLDATPG